MKKVPNFVRYEYMTTNILLQPRPEAARCGWRTLSEAKIEAWRNSQTLTPHGKRMQ